MLAGKAEVHRELFVCRLHLIRHLVVRVCLSLCPSGCSAAPTNTLLERMDANVTGSSFQCVRGTYTPPSGSVQPAWYTLNTDTVPGAGAGGGAGNPVQPVEKGMSMTDKILLAWMVLGAAVVVGLFAYWYYQRRARSAVPQEQQQQQQQYRAPLAQYPGGGGGGGGQDGAYTAM